MKRTFYVAVMAALLMMINACGGGTPSPDESAVAEMALIDSEPVALGELQYTLYCASCHGVGGQGDGPVADALKVRPTNLTLLKSTNDGVFPVDRLSAYIDGRQQVAAHGTRVMPVWGNVWSESDGEPVPEEEVALRISELVEYIRSIQE